MPRPVDSKPFGHRRLRDAAHRLRKVHDLIMSVLDDKDEYTVEEYSDEESARSAQSEGAAAGRKANKSESKPGQQRGRSTERGDRAKSRTPKRSPERAKVAPRTVQSPATVKGDQKSKDSSPRDHRRQDRRKEDQADQRSHQLALSSSGPGGKQGHKGYAATSWWGTANRWSWHNHDKGGGKGHGKGHGKEWSDRPRGCRGSGKNKGKKDKGHKPRREDAEHPRGAAATTGPESRPTSPPRRRRNRSSDSS
jgi:hypothetical protein